MSLWRVRVGIYVKNAKKLYVNDFIGEGSQTKSSQEVAINVERVKAEMKTYWVQEK